MTIPFTSSAAYFPCIIRPYIIRRGRHLYINRHLSCWRQRGANAFCPSLEQLPARPLWDNPGIVRVTGKLSGTKIGRGIVAHYPPVRRAPVLLVITTELEIYHCVAEESVTRWHPDFLYWHHNYLGTWICYIYIWTWKIKYGFSSRIFTTLLLLLIVEEKKQIFSAFRHSEMRQTLCTEIFISIPRYT